MNIQVNGKMKSLQEGTTVLQLLHELKIEPLMVAFELNSKIIKRSEYTNAKVSEGDKIEILTMIGGG